MKNKKETQCCAQNKTGIKSKNILQGLTYGLIPHIGCIAFIIASVLGVTVLVQFFKPLLMNPYFFHILVLLSLTFATISSILYLRKNGLLSSSGVKIKWKYLSTMFGSTIGVNVLLFLVIFPLLANVSIASPTNSLISGNGNNLSSISLQVDIPCSGHAALITQELKTINGITDVKFNFPNIFDVKYDPTRTSKEQILSLEVFKTYKPTVVNENSSPSQNSFNVQSSNARTGSCGCGCSGGCGIK